MENAHYHLEGLLRTVRSDLIEKTGEDVWLVRHCAWSLTRFAIGADGQLAFKRQRGKDYDGETACYGEAICHRVPLRIQTTMEPRWGLDGVFLEKLDLSDEVIVGTTKGIETTRSLRRMPARSILESRDFADVGGYRGTRGASSLTHLEEFANVTSRDLWCKSMMRTDGCTACH